MLTHALAVGLADDGIRVNAICPGPIDSTPLWEGVSCLARNPEIEREPGRAFSDRLQIPVGHHDICSRDAAVPEGDATISEDGVHVEVEFENGCLVTKTLEHSLDNLQRR